MNFRETTKRGIRAVAKLPIIGRLVRVLGAAWRGPQTRVEVAEMRVQLAKLQELSGKLQPNGPKDPLWDVVEGYGSAIRGIETSLRRHEIALGGLKSSLNEEILKGMTEKTDPILVRLGEMEQRVQREIPGIAEKLKWISVDSDNLRARLEFIRTEVMFEIRRQLKSGSAGPNKGVVKAPRFLNKERIAQISPLKLNLGCGHIPKEEYVNVDARDLPNVDLVSDVSALPFEESSINAIYAAHLVEHFSQQSLKDTVFPHWQKLLEPGGNLVLIAPDSRAMINGFISGEFTFDQLREITFGGQEYDGDFHFTMLTPESASSLLEEAGFRSVEVVATARRNGGCYEFELCAKK